MPMPPDAAATLEALREERAVLRASRDAERRALQALSTGLGRGPLPPIVEDPLLHLNAGRLVFQSRAEWAEGIWEIRLKNEDIIVERRHGAEPDAVDHTFESPVPTEPGWRLVVRVDEGTVSGWVYQQPSAENEWEARLRIDTLPAWWDPGPVAFSVWAVPATVLTSGDRP